MTAEAPILKATSVRDEAAAQVAGRPPSFACGLGLLHGGSNVADSKNVDPVQNLRYSLGLEWTPGSN